MRTEDQNNFTPRQTTWATRSRIGRLLVAGATSVFAVTGAPSAAASPIADCTSEVIDGVEVDYCVGNANSNIVTDVPGVNVEFEFGLGIGFG